MTVGRRRLALCATTAVLVSLIVGPSSPTSAETPVPAVSPSPWTTAIDVSGDAPQTVPHEADSDMRISASGDLSNQVALWIRTRGISTEVESARSSDGGRSWTTPQPVRANGGSPSTPTVLASRTGSEVLAAWRVTSSGQTRVEGVVSHDGGGTWGSPLALSEPSVAVGPPTLAMSSDGATMVLVYTWRDGTGVDQVFSTSSTDHGTSWSSAVPVFAGAQSASQAGVVLSPDAAIARAWWAGTDGAIYLSQSLDAGLTWGTPQSLNPDGPSGTSPDLAQSADGSRIVVAWSTVQDSLQATRVISSDDAGTSWSAPTDLAGGDPHVLSSTDGLRRMVVTTGTDAGGHVVNAAVSEGARAWTSHNLGGGSAQISDVRLSGADDLSTVSVLWFRDEWPGSQRWTLTRDGGSSWSPEAELYGGVSSAAATIVSSSDGSRLALGGGQATAGNLQPHAITMQYPGLTVAFSGSGSTGGLPPAPLTGLPGWTLSLPNIETTAGSSVGRRIGADYYGVNSGRPSTELQDSPFFGAVRLWDQPWSSSTLWCDVQPRADVDVDVALGQRLDPQLRAAAASGAKRIVLVLGPAPPWIYDSAAMQPLPGNFVPWYCGGDASATATSSPLWLGTRDSPGPARQRWSAYVDAVLRHVVSQFNGLPPFIVDLQTANEPNWTLLSNSGVPNSATTSGQIALSIVSIDGVVRERIDALPQEQRRQIRLMLSPLSSVSRSGQLYLKAADQVQAVSPLYDAVSFHSYSSETTGTETVQDLLTIYNSGTIARTSAYLDKLPALRTLPRHQTETNAGLVLPGGPTPVVLPESDEATLAARLYVDGLRWGLSSQMLYTANPSLPFVTGVRLDGDRLVAPSAVVTALRSVKSWTLDRDLIGCSVDWGVQACALRNPVTGAESMIVASANGEPITSSVPLGVNSLQQINGTSQQVTPGSPLILAADPVLLGGQAGTLVRSGGTFIGWNTRADGTGTSYAPDGDITLTADSELYPEWLAPPDMPDAPRGEVSGASVSLAWSEPARNNSDITGYTVQQSLSPDASTFTTVTSGTCASPVASTSCTLTNLTTGSTYYFRVSASNGLGSGSYSQPSVGLIPLGPPDAPGTPVGTSGLNEVLVAWTAPADTHGSAITEYVVERSTTTNSSDFAPVTSGTCAGGVAAPTVNCRVSSLDAGTTSYFRVKGRNSEGYGPYSAMSAGIAALGTPSTRSAPLAAADAKTGGAVVVTWTAASANGYAVDAYAVRVGTTAGVSDVTSGPPVSGTCTSPPSSGVLSCAVSGLYASTGYYFWIRAHNSMGWGAWSASSPATRPTASVPGAPYGLGGTPGDSSVTLRWTPPAENGAAITGYTVTTTPGGRSCSTGGAQTCTVTNLTNSTSYTFAVTATNAAGTGSSSSASPSVTPLARPNAPTGASASPMNAALRVTWVVPTARTGVTVTGYVATASPGLATCTTASATTTSCTISSLTNGTAYTVTVVATSANGPSAASAASAAATPRTVPGAPTLVKATAGNAKASVSWTAPTSTGGAAITGYTVTSTPGTKTCSTTGAVSCAVSGLTNGTAYTFTVKAANAAGSSSASASSSAVTPVGAPSVPGGVAASASGRVITVTWKAPTSNGGAAITSYTARVWTASSAGTQVTSCTSTGSVSVAPALRCSTPQVASGTYYVNVTATNSAALTSTASSPRVTVTA